MGRRKSYRRRKSLSNEERCFWYPSTFIKHLAARDGPRVGQPDGRRGRLSGCQCKRGGAMLTAPPDATTLIIVIQNIASVIVFVLKISIEQISRWASVFSDNSDFYAWKKSSRSIITNPRVSASS